jgi:mRNA-degrading endonuclease RelE of RelBE toxin-antitoxin system
MFEIEYSQNALDDLDWFSRREQNEILDGIEASLRYEPTIETRNRKRLRPNQTAEWELRIGRFRVYYDADAVVRIVSIEAIGLKMGNVVFFRGEEDL